MSAVERQFFFNGTCRTCMAREEDAVLQFHSIYSCPEGFETVNLRVSQLLNAITKQEPQPTDGLPTSVCDNCLKTLLGLYSFQQMCLKSENSMRSILEQHTKAIMAAGPTHAILHLPHVFELAETPTSSSSLSSARALHMDANDLTVGDIKNYSLFDTMMVKTNDPDSDVEVPVHKRRPTANTKHHNSQANQPKPRKIFTIAEKTNIIRKLESGTSNTSLARELGISHSTISTIWKNRNAIIESYDTESNQRRRLRATHNCDIESALLEWIKVQQHLNLPLSGTTIQTRANEISKEMGRHYYCTESWVYRFRVRHNIDVQKVQRHHHGDALRKNSNAMRMPRVVS